MSCESATARDKSDHSSLFLSAWSTHRRDDAGAFAGPNRQAEGEVHAFTAGYRVTLGAAPSRCTPKMMSAEWRALSVFLSAWSTHRRDDAVAFAAPNRRAEGEVHAFIAGYRMTLGAAPSRFAPKMMSGEWKALPRSWYRRRGLAHERGRAWHANPQLSPRCETLPVLRNFRLRYGLPCEFESANGERVGVVRR